MRFKLIRRGLLQLEVEVLVLFLVLKLFDDYLNKETSRMMVTCLSLHENQSEYEQKLIDKLLSSYNNKLRPSGTTQIKLALNLYQIIDVIEKDQIMVINAFVDHKWLDQRLAWDPAEFGNLTLIRINGDKLWTPDTFIYTTADQNGFLIPQAAAYFVVNNEGVIFWPSPQTQLRVRCRMGILWFPFDDQLCVVVFGSWSYSLHYLNYSLINEEPNLDTYTENNVWKLIAYKPFRNEVKYESWIENDQFSEIVYKILIRRKPLFVLQNCVIPAVMLCILTLVSFFIPFAPEMQIGISIMLAFSVFKLRLSDDVPVQSDIIPLINVYFTLCMSFSLSAMVWFSFRNILVENNSVPRCIRYIVIHYVWYLLFLNYLGKHYNLNADDENSKKTKSTTNQNTVANSNSKRLSYFAKMNSRKLKTLNNRYSNESKDAHKRNEHDIDHRGKKNLVIRIRTSNIEIDDEVKKNSKDELKSLMNHSSTRNGTHLKEASTSKDLSESETKNNSNSNNCKPSKTSSQYSDDSTKSKYTNATKPTKLIILKSNSKSGETISSIARAKDSLPIINESFHHLPVKIDKKINRLTVSDADVIKILNMFIFILFLIFIICLNLFGLFILPYFVKQSLSIND